MILYNITVIVNHDIEVEFQEWAHRIFLPILANSEIFKSQALLKVIDSPNEGETYSLQMIAAEAENIKQFQESHLALLHSKAQDVWANKIYLFESRMQYITVL